MNRYYFEGVAWIPGYNDTDFFQREVQAKTEEDAVKELKRIYSYMKGWTLVNVEKLK